MAIMDDNYTIENQAIIFDSMKLLKEDLTIVLHIGGVQEQRMGEEATR